MTSKKLHNITKITTCVDLYVASDGTVTTDAQKVEQRGTELVVGEGGGGRGVSMLNCGGMTIDGGTSTVNMGGIAITKTAGALELRGPGTTRLIVNGVGTTFDGVKGGTSTQQPDAARDTYVLTDSCCIAELSACGNGSLQVAPSFLDANELVVQVRGSSDVLLPSKAFKRLQISIAGSGDVFEEGSDYK